MTVSPVASVAVAVLRVHLGEHPIATLEKQRLNMRETWYKVVELYGEVTIG
jgi:hypothetical protein